MSLIIEPTPMRIEAASPVEPLRRLFGAEPWLAATGLALLALMIPTVAASILDDRLTNGIGVWTKPLKFQFSLAVYALTLAFFARYLAPGTRDRTWYRLYLAAVVAAICLEMVWLMGAATLGAPSHFNATPLGQQVYRTMGILATLLTSASAVYAFQIARNPHTGLSAAVKSGIVWGLALTLPLTLATAGTMSTMETHWVGATPSDAGGLTLMGWARDGGDLRVAHFFGTHAMHFMPLAGLVSAALLGATRVWPVRIAAAAFALFVGFVLAQALAGRPFLAALG